jgi:hypothetical protein
MKIFQHACTISSWLAVASQAGLELQCDGNETIAKVLDILHMRRQFPAFKCCPQLGKITQIMVLLVNISPNWCPKTQSTLKTIFNQYTLVAIEQMFSAVRILQDMWKIKVHHNYMPSSTPCFTIWAAVFVMICTLRMQSHQVTHNWSRQALASHFVCNRDMTCTSDTPCVLLEFEALETTV